GGPVVDPEGRLFTPTGNGPPEFVNTPFTWGQSLLRFDPVTDALTGTYTPQNVFDMEVNDVDLAGSTGLALNLNPHLTDAPKVMAFGGKQGSIYLLDRVSMPGGLTNRNESTAFERSLLPPVGGVTNVFGPDSPIRSNTDFAHARNSPAYFTDGHHAFLFAAG